MQPGFYPTNPFPKSLDENGISSDVTKLLQNINESIKKYALPACPLFLLFLIPLTLFYLPIFEPSVLSLRLAPFVSLAVLYICLSCFMHHKRRSGIKAAINEFNQTLLDKRIWAQWKSNSNLVNESDDGESKYDDQYTTSMFMHVISICIRRSRRSRRAMQPVLLIKRKGNVLPSGFENYASMQIYTVPSAPQVPYQVV